MAIWTVLEVCCQSKNNNYWHGLNVFMAQYYGDNVHGILDCVKGVLTAWKFTLSVSFYSLYGSIWWWKYLWQFGLPQGRSSSFKIVIIGVVSVSIFYIAEYHGDNIHDMLDCSKNVLAAQKLSLLLWFESLYDSMIWTQCPWEGRLSQGSKSYCWFDSPTPLDVIYD